MKVFGTFIAWILVLVGLLWLSSWFLSEALGIYGVNIGVLDGMTTLMAVSGVGWAFSLNQVTRNRMRDRE